MTTATKFVFDTNILHELLVATDERMKATEALPKKFKGIFLLLIDKQQINLHKEWDRFFGKMKIHFINSLKVAYPMQVELQKGDAYKAAYFFHFAAQFYNWFSKEGAKDKNETDLYKLDQQYILGVNIFFAKYQDLIGFRDEKLLTENAFKPV